MKWCVQRSFLRDGGRSSGIVEQEAVSNHPKLLLPKATVVNVREKVSRRDQVYCKETNANEPSMRCRKDLITLSEPRSLAFLRDKAGEYPAFRPVGNRHIGGVTLRLALMKELENLLF